MSDPEEVDTQTRPLQGARVRDACSRFPIFPYGIVVISLHLRYCNWSPVSSKSVICRPHDPHSSFHTAIAISLAESELGYDRARDLSDPTSGRYITLSSPAGW
jgi:hypothetical protein